MWKRLNSFGLLSATEEFKCDAQLHATQRYPTEPNYETKGEEGECIKNFKESEACSNLYNLRNVISRIIQGRL